VDPVSKFSTVDLAGACSTEPTLEGFEYYCRGGIWFLTAQIVACSVNEHQFMGSGEQGQRRAHFVLGAERVARAVDKEGGGGELREVGSAQIGVPPGGMQRVGKQ